MSWYSQDLSGQDVPPRAWSGVTFAPGSMPDADAILERLGQTGTAPLAPPSPTMVQEGGVRPVIFSPFTAPVDSAPEIESAVDAAAVDEALLEVEEPAEPAPDFEAIKLAAHEEGFQQGYEEGLRRGLAEQSELSSRLAALLQGVVGDTEELIRDLEDQVVELALAVAEKVIAREVRTDREVVIEVVRAALAEVHDVTELRIRVHPDDLDLVEPRWQQMLPRYVSERSELVPDELVERGGVVVESRIGHVDGQLKTRLSQVVNTFQGVLDGDPV